MQMLHGSIDDLSIVQVQHDPTYWSQQTETVTETHTNEVLKWHM